jgi:spoIIIJ-associated protein
MEAVVRTARTVEEAEELALKELGVDRSEVEVEILSRGKAGFLGIGAELARVRVTRLSEGGEAAGASEASGASGDVASAAVNTVNKILSLGRVNVVSTLRAANDPEVGGPIVDLTGEDSGLLIGRRGQTLQSLQFIVNLIVRKEYGENVRVVLDVEHYRQRREASLRDMATKVAARVAQTGRAITLEPMTAADRRVIHLALSNYPGVITESVGMGEERKVSIIPGHRSGDGPAGQD